MELTQEVDHRINKQTVHKFLISVPELCVCQELAKKQESYDFGECPSGSMTR